MWKSIVLCISLFSGAALGLSVGARFVEPAALPAAAAIGLCLIGVVLILAAPTAEAETTAAVERVSETGTQTVMATDVDPIELPTVAPVTNRTPALPFEAITP
ncbi:MAG TPA: hypothetical protein VN947_31975 [Polyangia bacterium]|nr:hypothetical protein [Polyangia bacterium]